MSQIKKEWAREEDESKSRERRNWDNESEYWKLKENKTGAQAVRRKSGTS